MAVGVLPVSKLPSPPSPARTDTDVSLLQDDDDNDDLAESLASVELTHKPSYSRSFMDIRSSGRQDLSPNSKGSGDPFDVYDYGSGRVDLELPLQPTNINQSPWKGQQAQQTSSLSMLFAENNGLKDVEKRPTIVKKSVLRMQQQQKWEMEKSSRKQFGVFEDVQGNINEGMVMMGGYVGSLKEVGVKDFKKNESNNIEMEIGTPTQASVGRFGKGLKGLGLGGVGVGSLEIKQQKTTKELWMEKLKSDAESLRRGIRNLKRKGLMVREQDVKVAVSNRRANVLIVHQNTAFSQFIIFCRKNPVACPLLAYTSISGNPTLIKHAGIVEPKFEIDEMDLDVRSDCPSYQTIRNQDSLRAFQIPDSNAHLTSELIVKDNISTKNPSVNSQLLTINKSDPQQLSPLSIGSGDEWTPPMSLEPSPVSFALPLPNLSPQDPHAYMNKGLPEEEVWEPTYGRSGDDASDGSEDVTDGFEGSLNNISSFASWTSHSRALLFRHIPAWNGPHLLYQSNFPLIPSSQFPASVSTFHTVIVAVSFTFTTPLSPLDEPLGVGWDCLKHFGLDRERVRRGEGDFGTRLFMEKEDERARGDPVVWPHWWTAVQVFRSHPSSSTTDVILGQGELVLDWERGQSVWEV